MIAPRLAPTPPAATPGQPPGPNPAAHGPAPVLRAQRTGLRLAGLPVGRLVAAQVLVAAAAVGVARQDVSGAAVAVVAAAFLPLILGRSHGRSLGRALVVQAVAARRRRRLTAGLPGTATGVAGGPAAPGVLADLCPQVVMTSVDLRPGRPLGVLCDNRGWAVALALGADDDVVDPAGPPRMLPGALLTTALAVDDVRLASVQFVAHTVAAPDHRLPSTAPAVIAHYQLPPPAPAAARRTLVVLRLEATIGADAIAARGDGTPGAARALRRAAQRTLELLDAAGVQARPLPADGLADAIATLTAAQAGPAPRTGAPGIAELATGLHLDGVEHITWRVETWPDGPSPATVLAAAVGALPAAATTLSLTFTPASDGAAAVTAHLRTVDPSPEAAVRTAQALATVTGAGLQLRRLDLEHAPGVLATLPRTAGAVAVDGRPHLVPVGAERLLDLPLPAAGVTLGIGADGPLPLRLFRSRPTQVALLTSGYVARLIALRAQAVGALVEVSSTRPDTWLPVITAAPVGRAGLVPPAAPMPAPAMLLRCDDLGPGAAVARPDVGPWQARLAVADFLPAGAVVGLRGFDLVLAQRIHPEVLGALAAEYDVPDDLRGTLVGLPDDTVAVLGAGPPRLVQLAPTEVETRLLGTPVRHDG